MKDRKIILERIFPPIPSRKWDWSAVFDGYEPGDPIGWGSSPEEATAELLDRLEECET